MPQKTYGKQFLIPIFSYNRAIPADLEGWLDVFLRRQNPILKLLRHSHNLAGFEACSTDGVRPPAISRLCETRAFASFLPPPLLLHRVASSCSTSAGAKASLVAASDWKGRTVEWPPWFAQIKAFIRILSCDATYNQQSHLNLYNTTVLAV